MIDRYTRPEMAALWTKQKKFETWLEVELNATDAWVKLGKVPAEAAAAMRKNAKFTVERVEEIEQSTRHDVVAFTRCVAESLGDESKYLHFGLTSTDVVDTALSSIVSQAQRKHRQHRAEPAHDVFQRVARKEQRQRRRQADHHQRIRNPVAILRPFFAKIRRFVLHSEIILSIVSFR